MVFKITSGKISLVIFIHTAIEKNFFKKIFVSLLFLNITLYKRPTIELYRKKKHECRRNSGAVCANYLQESDFFLKNTNSQICQTTDNRLTHT